MIRDEVHGFECFLADWGTAYVYGGKYFGGTPGYAGPRSFQPSNKDLFSFGRLALELFLDEAGRSQKLITIGHFHL